MDDLYGLTGDQVDRLRRLLQEFEGGTRLKPAETLRRQQPGAPIETYHVLTTGTITAAATVTTAITQLNGAINNSQTSMVVDSVADFLADRPFVVTIDTEEILVVGWTGISSIVIQRGYNGTTAASHADNANVNFVSFVLGSGDAYLSKGQLNSDADYYFQEDDQEPITIYNMATSTIATDTRLQVLRDPFSGIYVAIPQASGGSGITSINGDSTAAQVFSVGTSGTDFAITDTGPGTLRWDLPDASLTNRGAITTGTQTIGGLKTFNDLSTWMHSGAPDFVTYIAYPTSLSANSVVSSQDASGAWGWGIGWELANSSFVLEVFDGTYTSEFNFFGPGSFQITVDDLAVQQPAIIFHDITTSGSYTGQYGSPLGLQFTGGVWTGGSASVNLASEVTGTLPVANGGIGASLSGTGPGVVIQASSGANLTVVQGSSTGETAGFTAGSGTAVKDDSTFTGNVGSTAYRISDIVKHLKNAKIIAP